MFDLDQRLTRFLASAPDPTLVVDRTGSIVFASTQIEPVFGYSPGELLGAPVEVLMPERFRSGHTRLFQTYHSTPAPRPMGAGLDLYAQHKDGREFPVEISLSPVEDGSEIYVRCAIRDVSDRRSMEAQLRATASEAERANSVKSRFLAAASHDLRQPLQAATLYLSLLARQAKTPDQQELCAKVGPALQGMSRILDALLDISMLDSGSVTAKRSDFKLGSILERIAVDQRPLAQEKNLRFEYVETPAVVNSDPALLERIVENLASNAIRYTIEGCVTLRAISMGDVVRISVEDTGIGVPEDAVEKIFEEYFQFDNPARNIKKGLGLGLAIVRRLAKLLKHPIHVQSVLNSGSTFAVDVPLAEEAVATTIQPAHGPATLADQQLSVLFIEDDSEVADSLSMVLAAGGLKALAASDGREAVARLEAGFRPNIILADYRLPNETGLMVIARLRQSLGHEVPAIVMTGDTSLRDIESQIPKLRVAQKPVEPDVLLALIHEVAEQITAR